MTGLGSQFTHKRNKDYRSGFQRRCPTFVLLCATRFCRDIFQKPGVSSMWRRFDRCGTRAAIAFVSRETIVSVTLNMLISLLKDRFRLSKRRQNKSYAAALETGFLTAKKLCQSILAFKAGQVLLTRKNGADFGLKNKKAAAPKFDR